MINAIITIDYEIFGNGRGDVREHIINPMENILKICNRHNVSITIFLEMMEYFAFEKYDKELRDELGYSPMKEIRDQINRAYDDGHDVQLHIHPQFKNMRFDGDCFVLDQDLKPYRELKSDEVKAILDLCKNKLESIINSEDYECNCLRLSNIGWTKVPKNTVKPMKELGFVVHSLSQNIPNNDKGYWKMEEGIYEIPIHSKKAEFTELLSLKKLFIFTYMWAHYGDNLIDNVLFRPFTLLRSVANLKYQNDSDGRDNGNSKPKWDLSKSTYREIIQFLDIAKKRYDYQNKEIPLVMIGHTKNFFVKKDLDQFLNYVTTHRSDEIRFRSMNDYINIFFDQR